ncbi:SDR family oxidoreductase [Flavihumibacter solisilvae]|uniref:Short-chain dehydrogenase n=1 Tax=Flavihumibacter solisilvae TaxID=1349421 RepID=A0A0C1ILA3_9BACT|nr:SDR family oxidoreductase [Flavihumibacter solisilvae]KIC94960.1 short-chain dehydrogenase [Flavihumibacter solisilvae]
MDLSLQNKIILVTGGAKGIGEGIVRLLAAEGAIPVIIGRDAKDNQRLADELKANGNKVFTVTAELSVPEDCKMAVDAVLKEFGRIDGVVNNAGKNDGVGLESGSYEDFVASLHRNLIHYYLVVKYSLPSLIESKGSIVNITSKTAETGQGNTSAYAASNGGRNALTREWAVELLKYGIRVNAIVVAECWTPQYASWIETVPDPEATLARITKRIPLGNRMTTTEEIANTTAFLLSDRSSHTTGQLIHVDGGYVHLDKVIDY